MTVPGGGRVALRPVAAGDEEFLLSVYASTREQELAQVPWSEEQKTAFLRQQSEAQRREYDVRYPEAEYDVILLDGRPVGRLWIGRDEEQMAEYDARFPRAEYDVILVDGRAAGRIWVGGDGTQIRLLDIALLPEAQRKGVGAALLSRLVEEARATGRKLRHMVFIMNEGARRFYERHGFVVFEDLGGYLHMEWRGGGGEATTSGSS
jgi:GNAT superfamily N-acetyltransferase